MESLLQRAEIEEPEIDRLFYFVRVGTGQEHDRDMCLMDLDRAGGMGIGRWCRQGVDNQCELDG